MLLICFVHGCNFGVHAISNAPQLSSKTLQWIFGIAGCDLISWECISFMSSNIGISSRHAVDRAMYLASIVERAISICNLDSQVTGPPAYVMAHPECNFKVVGSVPAMLQSNPPAKSASTQHS